MARFPFASDLVNAQKGILFEHAGMLKIIRRVKVLNKNYKICYWRTSVKILPEEEKYNLSSQMRRAAVSITANIAEGYGRYHYQENIQFCRQSRGVLRMELHEINTTY